MQTKEQTHEVSSTQSTQPNGESLYRTKWLMAHNALHELVHNPNASEKEVWGKYLKELESSEQVATQPA